MLFVFCVLFVTIVLFASDRLRLDLVALLSLLALLLSNTLTPAEALAGFSDPLVLTIAGLFVVGGGIFQTGVASYLGQWLARLAGKSEGRLLVLTMGLVAALSGVMSSTGTTAVLLPVVVTVAWQAKHSPSKLLIPMAYASLLGGMLTLIGTPPNLVVSTYLSEAGLAPLGFFAITPVGLAMVLLGIGFMFMVGRQLLPARVRSADDDNGDTPTQDELAKTYRLPGNLFFLRVRRISPLIGQTIAQADLRAHYGVNLLEIQPWLERQPSPSWAQPVTPETILHSNDILHIQGRPADVTRLAREMGLMLLPGHDLQGPMLSEELGLVEVLLTPRSTLIGKTLSDVTFRRRYNVTVLAILRMGELLTTPLQTTPLRFGDTLLIQGTWERIGLLRREQRNFVVLGSGEEVAGSRLSRKAPWAVAIMVGMLLLMTFELLPTVTAVLLAAVAMVLTRCLTVNEAYETINWESVVLIASMLPMATALQKTGGVLFIVDGLMSLVGGWGPLAVMAGLFMLTSLFSQFISNTATAVLMAPIAFAAATQLTVSPVPFLVMVAVAASTSFATPVASPVNTLVLGPGGYRFGDYFKVGALLQLIIFIAAMLLVPFFFPLVNS